MTTPLAVTLRPQSVSDIVGQEHLTKNGGFIDRIISSQVPTSIILYGPPGTGKTSLANAIANDLQLTFEAFNASTDTKADLQKIANQSKKQPVLLLLDEIHRLDKPKQDYLLPFLENGQITLVGATTENPYIEVNPAIRSRTTILQVNPLQPKDIVTLLKKGLKHIETSMDIKVDISDDQLTFIASCSNGDARASINQLQLLVLSKNSASVQINDSDLETIVGRARIDGDKNGDTHYNLLSALQKSIRGSDVNASLHYLARLIKIGDLESICRRLSIIAFEDIGLADDQAIIITRFAIDTAKQTGFPEARIPLADAVVRLALSPKSNNAYKALDKALAVIDSGVDLTIPIHLRDTHFKGAESLGHTGYLYPHDYPKHWVNQLYLPENIQDHFYLDKSNLSTAHETELVTRAINIEQFNKKLKTQKD